MVTPPGLHIRDKESLYQFANSINGDLDSVRRRLEKGEEEARGLGLVNAGAKPSDYGATSAEKRASAAAKPAQQHANCNMDASVDPQQLRRERDALREGRNEDEAKLYELEQQADVRDNELKALRSERDVLIEQCKIKDASLEAERVIADKAEESRKDLEHELASAKHDFKLKLEQRNSDIEDLRANLDSAYAELRHRDDEVRTQAKQKDDAEARLYAVQLELQDAHDHYQASQELVEERDSQIYTLRALEQSNATLQAEADSLQEKVHENERDKLVKDARIMQLENMYQKVLADEQKALEKQAREQHAVDPTAEPPTAAQGQSLATELNEVDSDVDSDDFPGILEQSDPEVILEFSQIQTIDTTPVAPAIAIAPVPVEVATQTYLPELDLTKPEVVLDIAPVVHEEWQTQTEPVTLLDLAPIVQASNTQTEPTTLLDFAPVVQVSSTQTEPTIILDLAPIAQVSNTQTEPETVMDFSPVDAALQENIQTEPETVLDFAPVARQENTRTEPETILDLAPIAQQKHTQIEPETILDFAPTAQQENTQTEPETILDFAPAPIALQEYTRTEPTTIVDLAPTVSQATHTQTEPTTIFDLAPTVPVYDPSPVDEGVPNAPRFKKLRLPMSDQNTQTDPQPQTHPTTIIVRSKKGGFFSWSTILAIVFALFAINYYSEAHAWRHTDRAVGLNRLYHTRGYRQRGRHLFSTIPVCYEHQANFIAESFCEQWEVGVKAMERYIGIPDYRRW